MPELPEVETVVRGLRNELLDFRFRDISVLHPRAIKNGSIDPVALKGAKIESVDRKGKFIWFGLNKDFAFITHLGMSGQYLFADSTADLPPYTRAFFTFSPKKILAFNDQRTFGWVGVDQVVKVNGFDTPASFLKVAYDIFDLNFDKNLVVKKYLDSNAKIKHLLLDQGIMSGVGNIYADEALWYARIHPDRRGVSLSKEEVNSLLRKVKFVLKRAVNLGGTSFDEQYVDTNGLAGSAIKHIKVYGREDKGCFRCGSFIIRIPFGVRYTRFCPGCQL
jgi:formamidopyrimidine-DNA glycosylase